MMRLLFLCLLLPAATVLSYDVEGSGGEGLDDEDFPIRKDESRLMHGSASPSINEESSDQITLIIVVVAVAALTLSVAAIVTIMLVRRHMHRRQQGIYSVPTEQDKKGAV